MDKGKKINWKNGLLLSAVSYLLYIIIWLVLDYETARQLPEMALIDYMVDLPHWDSVISCSMCSRSKPLMSGSSYMPRAC